MNENEKYFLNSLHSVAPRCALIRFAPSGRLTRDIRFGARLAIFPNSLHFVPQTSHNSDFNRHVYYERNMIQSL
jgi:hypothetical protein